MQMRSRLSPALWFGWYMLDRSPRELLLLRQIDHMGAALAQVRTRRRRALFEVVHQLHVVVLCLVLVVLIVLPLQIHRLVVTVGSRVRRLVLLRIESRQVDRETIESIILKLTWLLLVCLHRLAVFLLELIKGFALDVGGGECSFRSSSLCVPEVGVPATNEQGQLVRCLLSPWLGRFRLLWPPWRCDHHDFLALLDSCGLCPSYAGVLWLARPLRASVRHCLRLHQEGTICIIVNCHVVLSKVARLPMPVWLRLLRPPGPCLE